MFIVSICEMNRLLITHSIFDLNLRIKNTMFLHYSRRVLKATEGIENFGGIRWELLGAVLGAWVGIEQQCKNLN